MSLLYFYRDRWGCPASAIDNEWPIQLWLMQHISAYPCSVDHQKWTDSSLLCYGVWLDGRPWAAAAQSQRWFPMAWSVGAQPTPSLARWWCPDSSTEFWRHVWWQVGWTSVNVLPSLQLLAFNEKMNAFFKKKIWNEMIKRQCNRPMCKKYTLYLTYRKWRYLREAGLEDLKIGRHGRCFFPLYRPFISKSRSNWGTTTSLVGGRGAAESDLTLVASLSVL